MSAALLYVPHTSILPLQLVSLETKIALQARIIATVSRGYKDFFIFLVDNRKPLKTVILTQFPLVFNP
jgi:hypothetical protein